MTLVFGEEGAEWGRCCLKSDGGESLAVLAKSNNHKITFLLSLSSTKTQVFFSSFAPSSFFFFSQPHTIVNTMMAALKHWSGFSAGQDSTPLCTLHRILHWSQLCDCGWGEDASSPFLVADRKLSDSGFFPPFFHRLSQLPPFNFCLSPSYGSSPVVQ